jgi:hypothetical protein
MALGTWWLLGSASLQRLAPMSPHGSMLVVAHRSCLPAEAASRAACGSVLMVAHRFWLPIESSSRAATWLCARGGSLVLHPPRRSRVPCHHVAHRSAVQHQNRQYLMASLPNLVGYAYSDITCTHVVEHINSVSWELPCFNCQYDTFIPGRVVTVFIKYRSLLQRLLMVWCSSPRSGMLGPSGLMMAMCRGPNSVDSW